MYLHALATAVPPASFTQKQCWELFHQSDARKQLTTRSVGLMEKVLLGNSGIEKRHFAVPNLESLFDSSAEKLNQSFEKEAPALASTALGEALRSAGWDPQTLDGLIICTCTGYLCPGLTSHVAEKLGLRPNAYLQDLVGLGCGAAIPALRAASNMVSAPSEREVRVAVIAVEICSAAFYLENDPGVLISACIFSDGAAATLWSSLPGAPDIRIHGFDTLHIPEDREYLRFLNSGGKLKNRLHRSVPQRARRAVHHLWKNRPATDDPPPRIVAHSGGKDVLKELSTQFPEQDFSSAQTILQKYGNMSSPSMLFALEEELSRQSPAPVEGSSAHYWLVAFGAGFSAHSCHLVRGG